MDSQLELTLIECLGRLDDGEPIDSILARYPDQAASLLPLLETATALDDLRSAPRESARIASRRAFLAQAHELREATSRRRFWLPRRMAIGVAALAAAFAFIGGAVAASASALPNEPLYGVKRTVEDAQLMVAGGAEKAQLAASFGQRRRDEINVLLAMRRDTAIAFEGTIESMQPNGWEVSGLYIYLDRATAIDGAPSVGSRARIQGHTEAGKLRADSISIAPGSGPAVVATATATATPPATAAPSATPSPAPSATPQPSPTPQPTASPIPEPTRVPTTAPRLRAPTAPPTAVPPTPVPPTQESDHGGNGGVDDHGGTGGNDGSGSNGGSDSSGSGSNDASGGSDGSGSNGGSDSSGSGSNDASGGSGSGSNDASGGGSDSGGSSGGSGGSSGGSGGSDSGGDHHGGGDDKP